MKLNDNEKIILKVLADSYDTSGWDETGFYSFNPLVELTGIERRKVRLACRSLKRKGLAKFEKALTDMDGMFAGAGYSGDEMTAHGFRATFSMLSQCYRMRATIGTQMR